MRAHLLQYDIAWEDREANFRTVEAMVRGADADEGDLVILPEMFDSGFSLNHETTADDRNETLGFLCALARDFGVWVHGSRTIRHCHERMARNMATVIDPEGEPVCEYAKMHPFSFGRESERFTGGRDIASYAWRPSLEQGDGADGESATVGCAICYDLRFPELFRALAAEGCEVFAIGANWPAARQDHWRTLLRARAIENQAIVFAVNRSGEDPYIKYAGGTIALDAKGEVLGELAHEPGVLSVEAPIGELREWRKTFPALQDQRLGIRTTITE